MANPYAHITHCPICNEPLYRYHSIEQSHWDPCYGVDRLHTFNAPNDNDDKVYFGYGDNNSPEWCSITFDYAVDRADITHHFRDGFDKGVYRPFWTTSVQASKFAFIPNDYPDFVRKVERIHRAEEVCPICDTVCKKPLSAAMRHTINGEPRSAHRYEHIRAFKHTNHWMDEYYEDYCYYVDNDVYEVLVYSDGVIELYHYVSSTTGRYGYWWYWTVEPGDLDFNPKDPNPIIEKIRLLEAVGMANDA